jgi:hypothetical protein
MTKDPDQWPNLQQQMMTMEVAFWEPIGRYVFHFGRLEHEVDRSLIALLKVEWHTGELIAKSIQNLLAKMALVQALARMRVGHHSTLVSELSKIIDRVEAQYTFRNDLVHGGWNAAFHDHKEGMFAWVKNKLSKNNKFRNFTVTVEAINQNDKEAQDVARQLNEMWFRILATERDAAQPPSPDKSAAPHAEE